MSGYSVAIAREMGLGQGTLEALLSVAPMHDVGKLGIPDHILRKPGPLTPEEWEVMKEHTLIGARVLGEARSEYMRLARTIALTHHEKWDGTGYPKGLKGLEIPMVGRIAALAGVFDALTTSRPYKEPLSPKAALDIRQGRGKHFDPEVVDAFLRIWEEILAIRERYSDERSETKWPMGRAWPVSARPERSPSDGVPAPDRKPRPEGPAKLRAARETAGRVALVA